MTTTTLSKRLLLADKHPGKVPQTIEQAVTVLKQYNNTKFDQTVDIAMRLGVDAKQADQIVRGSIVLPHGIGKTLRVIVFAKGDQADQAKASGRTKSAAKNWPKRSKTAGPTSMLVSPLRT